MSPISRTDFRLTIPHDPTEQPRPTVRINPRLPNEVKEIVRKATIRAPTLGFSLLRSAYHLACISSESAEGYLEGRLLGDRCVASATGAIAVACAGVEAVMNEFILFCQELPLEPAKRVLLGQAVGFSTRDRVSAIAGLADRQADWGTEPLQSYDLLLAMRRVLIHHEPDWIVTAEGYWPVAKLKALVAKIQSPYAAIDALDWEDHLLSPNGANWAVDVAFAIANMLEEFYDAIHPEGPGIL